MHTTRRTAAGFVIATTALLGTFAGPAHAQAWPQKPIKMIVPYAAGGPADSLARMLASKMQTALGQPVVVDNRGGAGGALGVDATVKAAADGYTIALVAPGPLAGMPNLSKTPYTLDDIDFLAPVAKIPSVIVVNSKSGIDSLEALLAKARSNPGRLNYSSAGPGTTPHIGTEILKNQAKVSLLHIPYRGAAPAITALLGSEVDLTMVDLLPALPHVQSGAFKVLAVAGTTRSPQLPNVPTTAEKGLPGVTMETTYGVIGPKGLPTAVAHKIHEAVQAALGAPDLKQSLQQQGAITLSNTPAEYQQMMRAESDKWKNIIAKAQITMN